MARIAKVKLKDGNVHIHEMSGEGTAIESRTEHKIYGQPHPDFTSALDERIKHARGILEWGPGQYQNRVRVTGVSWSMSEDTGVEGAVITGLVELEECDSPFSFNTPHMPFEQYSETGQTKLMPEETRDALEAFRGEAYQFLHKGKRAQLDLFDAGTSKSEPTIFDATPAGAH